MHSTVENIHESQHLVHLAQNGTCPPVTRVDCRVHLVAPDVGGPDQQFILVTRHVNDPTFIVVAVHPNVIDATDGWVDGIYVITDGELQEVGDL